MAEERGFTSVFWKIYDAMHSGHDKAFVYEAR